MIPHAFPSSKKSERKEHPVSETRISVISKRDVCIQHQPIKTLKKKTNPFRISEKNPCKKEATSFITYIQNHSDIIKTIGKNIRYHQIISNPLKNLSKVNQKPIKNPSYPDENLVPGS